MRARSVIGLAAGLVLAASSGWAAARRPAPRASAAPDAFAGYSFTHAGEANLHGIGLSGSYPLRGRLSLVAELSGHDGSFAGADLGQLGVMAGSRFRHPAGRFQPFAEALLGGVRTSVSVDLGTARVSDADWDWGLALGGGVDYALRGRVCVRGLVQLRLLKGEGAWDTDPRLALGVSYRFGR